MQASLCFEGGLAADEIVALARGLDSPAFGCYFDPANLVVAGLDPDAEARTLGAAHSARACQGHA